MFIVSVTPSINTHEPSNNFMISIASFTSSIWSHSFFSTFFLSNLFIAFEVKLLTNPSKLSLAKEISIFVSAFFPKLPNKDLKDILD